MYESAGKLILRLALGGLILFHGVSKLMHGIDPILGIVSGSHLPSFVAYGVYLGEIVGPLLLILGWYTRVGAALIAINMLFALALVHRSELFTLNPQSGGWALELQGMYLFTAIALMIMNPGRYSLDARPSEHK
jgi:putative oxidoreductase